MAIIHVSFPVDQETWNKVVVEAVEEDSVVKTVGDETFIVEYKDHKAWDVATNRFNGTVQVTVLNKDRFQF